MVYDMAANYRLVYQRRECRTCGLTKECTFCDFCNGWFCRKDECGDD